jgi:hypothetical protein
MNTLKISGLAVNCEKVGREYFITTGLGKVDPSRNLNENPDKFFGNFEIDLNLSRELTKEEEATLRTFMQTGGGLGLLAVADYLKEKDIDFDVNIPETYSVQLNLLKEISKMSQEDYLKFKNEGVVPENIKAILSSEKAKKAFQETGTFGYDLSFYTDAMVKIGNGNIKDFIHHYRAEKLIERGYGAEMIPKLYVRAKTYEQNVSAVDEKIQIFNAINEVDESAFTEESVQGLIKEIGDFTVKVNSYVNYLDKNSVNRMAEDLFKRDTGIFSGLVTLGTTLHKDKNLFPALLKQASDKIYELQDIIDYAPDFLKGKTIEDYIKREIEFGFDVAIASMKLSEEEELEMREFIKNSIDEYVAQKKAEQQEQQVVIKRRKNKLKEVDVAAEIDEINALLNSADNSTNKKTRARKVD